MIPYARQNINSEDIAALASVLRGDFITTGPKVEEFEKKFSSYVGAKFGVAVSSGTAALHLACLACGLKPAEELITSSLTFAASANCALYCGAKPVFVDINEQGLIDEKLIKKRINKKTKIIIPVHYGGLPCNLKKIKEAADKHGLVVIEDACHALGAKYRKSKIGDCAYSEMCVFSFHPVKHITTGEGGMITTNSENYYKKLLMLRSHGITKEVSNFQFPISKERGSWYYEMNELGYNYRITDFQCALGISQLTRITKFIKRRREIAKKYDGAFQGSKHIEVSKENKDHFCSYHLYPIRVKNEEIRGKLFDHLKKRGIFCQVHYIPVYWHPYYKKLGFKRGLCRRAEEFYLREISLPLYHTLKNKEVDFIIKSIINFFNIQ